MSAHHRASHSTALSPAKSRAAQSRAIRTVIESLESRTLLSGSNAIDRLDFGALSSEAAHNFDPGLAPSQLPILGVGQFGLSYREPFGSGANNPYSSQGLTFTMTVDSSKQNYLTVKVWGGDAPNGQMYLLNAPSTYPFIIDNGTPPVFPNRFEYYTFPIPIAWTTGKTSTQLTLNFVETFDAYGGTGFHYLTKGELTQPIYSAFTHTDPQFVPDSSDATGTKPTQTGQANLSTLTSTQATSILTTVRNSIYAGGSNSYYTQLLNRQILSTSPGSPPTQAVGLDLFTNATTWGSAGKTAAQWDSQIAAQKPQPGYTALPDELLSVLYTTYLLPSLPDVTISGEPNQYDSTVLQRIVSLLDGATYMQGSDGGFPTQSSPWVGLVSNLASNSAPTARTAAGTGGYLEGIDTQSLGWAIISLLNDPTAKANFQTYLGQSYNADLTVGGSMLRATAYERMLFNHITYLINTPGGAESQQLFQISGLYASAIALEKLQALYPNASYVFSEASALNYVKMVMGLIPDTLRNLDATGTGLTNFGLSAKGLGEANGALSGGFDGGYGLWLTMLAPDMAALAAVDPGIDAATQSNVATQARATIDAFDQFISPEDYISGSNDIFTMGPEDFITYRNNDNPNSNSASTAAGTGGNGSMVFNVDSRYQASDPSGAIHDAYALRSAYLETQYGVFPAITAVDTSAQRLNFLRDLPAYESTIRALVNVAPTAMTPLPGEPGQPDYAWADPTTGAVAFHNDGEWFFMNTNWRSKEFNNNSFSSLNPSEIARIHYTTATVDRAAMIYLPYNSSTVQSDGNLSGGMTQAWYVRYGDYLIVLNHSTSATNAKLPAGAGMAEDLLTHNFYKLGTTVSVAAGQAAIFWLTPPAVSGGADIGSVGVAGSDSYTNSSRTYTVTASGSDIGGLLDGFRFVAASVTGNVNLTTQLLSQTNTDLAAQAGLMIRDGTSASAIFAAVVRTPGDGLRFEYRAATGGAVAWSAAVTPLGPVWLKLARSGNAVSGYYSTDGSSWTQIGTTQTLSLPTTTQAGLAVTSHNNTATSTALFTGLVISSDNQTTSTNTAPTIATAANASTSIVTGKTVTLNVLGADDNGEGSLTYNWQTITGSPVTFSASGTNAAKNTTVTFLAAGSYTFRVTITDAAGFSTTSDVSVTVNSTFTGISISPNPAPVYLGASATQQFNVLAVDQFGAIMSGLSPAVTWSNTGVGSVDPNGLYTAPANGSGAALVKATAGALTATASITCIGAFTASQDVGSPNITGSASYNSTTGTYTILGNGSDIWVGLDQFRFVYIPIVGDATITAKVSVTDSDTSAGSAKAGIMFRSSLDKVAAYALMAQTWSVGPDYQWRLTNSGGDGKSQIGSGTNTGWVRLVRTGNVFTSFYSSDGVTWSHTAINTQTIPMGETIYAGLAVTSRNNSTVNTATITDVTIQTSNTPTFPADADIGGPSPAGSYSEDAGLATLSAGGVDIYSNSDQFHFAYKAITGDATLTARVVSLVNTNTNAKAGVMIRNTLDAGSAEASALVTATNGINFDSRSSLNGSSTETKVAGLAAPYWVRIVRSGSSFSAFRSPDGTTWTQIGTTRTISMNSTVLIGLAVTSHDQGTATTATFDNLSITAAADAAPTVATPAAAPATITGASANLSVLGADTDGSESNLTYTWSVANRAPGPVSFGPNGTNASKNSTATFTRAGTYILQATITDQGALTAASQVTVTVNQTLTSVAVTPASLNITPGQSRQFSAVALDQFGQPMSSQPASFTWSAGAGTIDSTGFYTAPLTGNSDTIQAITASAGGTTNLSIVNQSPLIATSIGAAWGTSDTVGTTIGIGVPAHDDGGDANLTYAWSAINNPPGPVTFGANVASTTATFTQPGSYTLQVLITDAAGASITSTFNFVYLNGDADSDGTIGILDFNALAANFGMSGRTWSQGDFNHDGIVNLLDLNVLASNFGQTVSSAPAVPDSVPAPSQALPDLFSTQPVTSNDSIDQSILQ
jgi:PKD domain